MSSPSSKPSTGVSTPHTATSGKSASTATSKGASSPKSPVSAKPMLAQNPNAGPPKKEMPAQNPKAGPPKKELKKKPCPPHLCTLVPIDVPAPEYTQAILHPRKDVFVLKVAKVGPNGDRRCKMELELVTPKSLEKTPPYRIDTRETQCDPECPCCGRCGARPPTRGKKC